MRSCDDIAADWLSWCCYPIVLYDQACFVGKKCVSSLKTKSLQDKVDILTQKHENLSLKEAEMRSELRICKGKLNNKVLVWLDDVEDIQSQFREIRISLQQSNTLYSNRAFRSLVIKLIHKVDNLHESAYSLPLQANLADVFPPMLITQTLGGLSYTNFFDEIWKYFMDPMIGTIGVYGAGGMGKTTIMMNIRNQLSRTERFDKIIWITMTQNRERAQVDIAAQLGMALPMYDSKHSRGRRIFEMLKNVKRYLFILDAMWKPVPLDTLGIPPPTSVNGCKIVLTTRSLDVCLKMCVDKSIYIAELSEKEAWNLFVKKSGHQVLAPEIQIIAQEVLHECDGLPLAISTVGHAMRDKVDVAGWREALKDLRNTQAVIQGGMDKVFGLLRYGYQHLKSDTVRQCFMYCGFFPKDHKFESKELIAYWMAEDLIYRDGDIVTSIDMGLEIVEELKAANMLERGIEWLKMHDLFRNLAIRILTEDYGFLVKDGPGLTDFPYDWEWVGAKKISLIRKRIEVLQSVKPICSNLSTLLLKDNPLSHISPSFFTQMPNLQVLDMSYSGITEMPQSLSELAKLRVLFLQHCTGLKKIPSLEKLTELEVLNLCGTLIKELPQGMEGLVNLRSLDLSETTRLENIQVGVISALSNLEELRMQRSRLCKIDSPIVANCFKEIRCLKHLALLTLSAVGFEDHLDTIVHLEEQSLKSYSINVYGCSRDYIEDMDNF